MTPTDSLDLIGQLTQRFATSELAEQDPRDIVSLVDQLCSAYSTDDPSQLRTKAEAVLTEIDQLLARRLTLSDQAMLLEQAGWLALLLAALAYDLGLPVDAEQSRELALVVGKDLDSPSILAWAHETAVWIEISNSNWNEAIHKATRGLEIAGQNEPTGAAIQLSLERAEAFARLGDVDGMKESLDLARSHLSRHEPPANPKNHFRFDHAKFDLRQMRTLLVVGHDQEAEQIAIRLQADLQNPDGTSQHPMRTSEILASRGLIEARRGNIDKAADYGEQAIDIGRRSRLSFQQITAALAAAMADHEEHPAARLFLDRRNEIVRTD